MSKKVRRPNVAKGTLVPLGNGFSLAIGTHPEKTDDIDIGPNNKNGLSVNHGEILQSKGDGVRVFSAEPILGGISPAQLLYGGANPNAVFTAQEQYKRANRIADDGSHYKKGGQTQTPVKEELTKEQRDSSQVNIFKPGSNDVIQKNRIAHRASLEKFVKDNPELYGLKTSDFVDFLLDNATMESGNSSNAKKGSMYGYYQLKGLSPKSTEAEQHNAAFKHLKNLFSNVLTDADVEKANELGISQTQLLHKVWNQERKVLNYLYQGKDSSDGLGTKISEWGNNNSLDINYVPYLMNATYDNNITIKKGDNPEKLLKSYRGAGLEYRTFNNHAKDYETVFSGNPNKLKIGDTLTNNYVIGPRKPDGTFKYGGIHIKPSKKGTFTAAAKKHGMSVQGFASKVLANKDNYSPAMVKKANFARNAKRWKHALGGEDSLLNPLGERPNVKSNNMKQNKRNKALDGTKWYRDPATGLMMPKVGLPMEPVSQAPKQIMVGEQRNILNTPFDTRTFHEGVVEPKIITIPNKMRGLYDSLNSTNPIQPTTFVKTSSPNFWQKAGNFLGSAQGADVIGALINAGGAIGSAIINNKAINKLKYTDKQYAIYNPAKLKTKININPQIAKMRETVAGLSDAARKTSASSRNTYQKIANTRLAALDSYRSLLGEKENKETELINQDRLNQQQVGMRTASDMMNTINTNIAGKDNLDNTKSMLKAQNNVALVNNLAGIVAGPQGLLARRDARRSQAANLAAMSLAYPDAAKLLQGDYWKNAFKGYYNMLNNKIGV